MPQMDLSSLSLDRLASFHEAHATGIEPRDILAEVYRRIDAGKESAAWISVMPFETALGLLGNAITRRDRGEAVPLLGIPFAVKDNIDVAGLPTTAGCPEFAYVPDRHAIVVERLVAAGAIPIGKTNLDQFAAGLNGTRSPYGIPTCVFDDRYISGGSSSGSAVAVASKIVPFALGTDTAGSGRVPASVNNLVGLKPTKGLLSTSGLVPAARSLDCITVFAHTVDDALTITHIVAAFDPADPYSRKAPQDALSTEPWPVHFRFGVPRHLEFFGDDEAAKLFDDAVSRLEALGGECVRFDYTPFLKTATLLYSGPWLAERLAAIEKFASEKRSAIHPVVRDIIFAAEEMSAVDAFQGSYDLAAFTRQAEAVWDMIDVMLLPTTPTMYRVDEMLADPVRLNSNLGFYTNFVNLMDLSAIAVPAGFRPNGLPFGVSLIGRAFEDGRIASLGLAFLGQAREINEHREKEQTLVEDSIAIAVVGAHLTGQPLNHQLTERQGVLRQTTRTAPGYAFYALAGTVPAKPGLIRDESAAGLIEVEVWELPAAGFSTFVNEIPAPLGIGTLTLEDGSLVKGFLCEPYALRGADDITQFGGWRAYRASLATAPSA